MKHRIRILSFVLVAVLMTSCTYHNEEEYFGANTNSCDTINMSFTTNILPVLENNCFACHNSTDRSGGITLDQYNGVKSAAESGRLLGAIKHEMNFSNMPKSAAKLDDCTINQIEAWINQGTPDN